MIRKVLVLIFSLMVSLAYANDTFKSYNERYLNAISENNINEIQEISYDLERITKNKKNVDEWVWMYASTLQQLKKYPLLREVLEKIDLEKPNINTKMGVCFLEEKLNGGSHGCFINAKSRLILESDYYNNINYWFTVRFISGDIDIKSEKDNLRKTTLSVDELNYIRFTEKKEIINAMFP
ncbi:hypothetical protein ACWA5Z_12195 [Testudinibacter sp. P80/BLE/0925]|uniref:hypothetical protein n=1 Tax=Testudinibacter sp. TW-1 TaxID=3417757 RepID=UPI003D368003